MLRLTNTLTGHLDEFTPAVGNTVRMYICGPTVHDFAHIGNFRTFVFEDILRRHLRSKGWRIEEVMNITDVDDKIIRRALDQGVDIRTYTEKYIAKFLEDWTTLRIEKPEKIVRATDHIPEMVELVRRLLDQGYAYREGGSVYFRIARFPDYGKLAGLEKKKLRPGARVDVDEYDKEAPQDFALWKAPKDENEPQWETEIGSGRPGWHLECSAMSMKYLGESFDLHCGGADLIFPHHENEIAQSEAATGQRFVRFWIHSGHLKVEGQKMAKSKGNFYLLRDLLDKGYDPLAIRYLLVSVPYRRQLNFTFGGLHQAAQSLDRIKEFLFRLGSTTLASGQDPKMRDTLAGFRNAFEEALDDDLNTALALAAVFNLIKAANTALDNGAIAAGNRQEIEAWFREVDDRLGIVPDLGRPSSREAVREVSDSSATTDGNRIEALIAERNQARAKRDFDRADEIRQELVAMGIVIEDTHEGTRWRYK
jgi:cysteinyl-tRNA synthetase